MVRTLPTKKSSPGQVLIGVIISMGIFTILSHAVITLVFTAYDLIIFTRTRTAAQHIANQKIETIRNLPFDSVGTVGGIPPGFLEQEESILRNGQRYNVKTAIIYVDDGFDGYAPDDPLPNDYKRVRVDISWGGITPSNSSTVTLITDVAPKGIETTTGGGTISLLVFDAESVPVNQAQVHVVASSASPPVNINLQTNSTGRVILPGAPACTDCYEITVTKDGYSSERTYSVAEIANPAKPHLTVLEGELTEITFAIDQLSTIELITTEERDNGFAPLPNQTLHIQSQKSIGTTEFDEPVYKIDQDIQTDSNGQLSLPNTEWDTYTISLPTGSTEVFSGTNPLLPLSLLPGITQELKLAISSQTPQSALITFLNGSATQVSSVEATIKKDAFEASSSSGLDTDPDYGQVYFPDLETGLYTIIATASGFQEFTGEINITGNIWETKPLTEQ